MNQDSNNVQISSVYSEAYWRREKTGIGQFINDVVDHVRDAYNFVVDALVPPPPVDLELEAIKPDLAPTQPMTNDNRTPTQQELFTEGAALGDLATRIIDALKDIEREQKERINAAGLANDNITDGQASLRLESSDHAIEERPVDFYEMCSGFDKDGRFISDDDGLEL